MIHLLQKARCWFGGGLVSDFTRRLKYYPSDFKDGNYTFRYEWLITYSTYCDGPDASAHCWDPHPGTGQASTSYAHASCTMMHASFKSLSNPLCLFFLSQTTFSFYSCTITIILLPLFLPSSFFLFFDHHPSSSFFTIILLPLFCIFLVCLGLFFVCIYQLWEINIWCFPRVFRVRISI